MCAWTPDLESPSEPVDLTIRVRYAETDQMGIVYYANYFVWFELGRTELLRQRGFTYRDVEERDDCYIVVADARCTYRAPARYDDVITIRTRMTGLRSRVLTFEYEILAEDGRLLATGETTHVVTDRQGRPRALPAKYRQALVPLLAAPPRDPPAAADRSRRRGRRPLRSRPATVRSTRGRSSPPRSR